MFKVGILDNFNLSSIIDVNNDSLIKGEKMINDEIKLTCMTSTG
mgnify:CR=1 FL=1